MSQKDTPSIHDFAKKECRFLQDFERACEVDAVKKIYRGIQFSFLETGAEAHFPRADFSDAQHYFSQELKEKGAFEDTEIEAYLESVKKQMNKKTADAMQKSIDVFKGKGI